MDFIFDSYHIQSAEAGNTINLELPLQPLQRALRSAQNAASASMRLTKKDGVPLLSMTITLPPSSSSGGGTAGGGVGGIAGGGYGYGRPRLGRGSTAASGVASEIGTDPFATQHQDDDSHFEPEPLVPRQQDQSLIDLAPRRERDRIVTHDIPVRVLHPGSVETIMQPSVREPDVHIQMPPLLQLKAISDRFTRLAATSSGGSSSTTLGGATGRETGVTTSSGGAPKLELSANMHGSLRLRVVTDGLSISSVWTGLPNPELDPAQLTGPPEEHPSEAYRRAGPDKWATVRVDGKDWSRVLSVGRLEGRVIACFAHDHALILYVYVPNYEEVDAEDSVVTVGSQVTTQTIAFYA